MNNTETDQFLQRILPYADKNAFDNPWVYDFGLQPELEPIPDPFCKKLKKLTLTPQEERDRLLRAQTVFRMLKKQKCSKIVPK